MKKNNKKDRKKKVNNKGKVYFPASLLIPIGKFLHNRLKSLERRKKTIDKEDPFKDTARLDENASPDSDAAEQFGHASTSAIRSQVDKRIIETRKALSRIKIGKYGICEDCGKMIDTDRLIVYPEATFCAKCKAKREK
ncbi:MAG TPA: TraR/DksA C4-type zinc finger protein [Patescibacteria group bacterium]|nr:TraR/DksA C4-type zinc finger protein [Patescibacteria group bacterium]